MAAVPVDFLVSKIVSVLENEATLLGGARDELEDIKGELVSMRSFLQDHMRRQPDQTEGEKTWVANVRDLAYDVEDIIDEFMYRVNMEQSRRKSARYICKITGLPKDLWAKHQIITRLQKIKTLIKAIPERNQRYGVNYQPEAGTRFADGDRGKIYGESCLFLKEDELVGIEDEREVLVGWLRNGETKRITISVVGMGGSGKTTLVSQAYNCGTVKRNFDCYAWISVSQNYVIEDLLRSLIKQFYQARKESMHMDLNIMGYRQLVEILVNYLERRRYMVVLDDVWHTDLWNQIKVALPNSIDGCRVILTTRKEDVAAVSFEVGGHVHYIKPLARNEAWSLFCLKAFSKNENKCPTQLESLAKAIVEKCQGLPLAIVSLGGLLSTKNSEPEWRMVYDSLNWELSNNQMLQAVKSILLLSYDDLPYRLKHCFLYCCLFPEDYSIKRKKLIRLWMAEGFVEVVRGLAPEEVAERYLIELINRSMLQVEERNSHGLPKACKMHDLLRELALSISEEEKFCSVYNEQRAGARDDDVARRLSVRATEGEAKFFGDMSKLRSFILFATGILNQTSLIKLLSEFRLLRVLDLEDAPIDTLPNGIVSLFNLRYLNLKRTQVKELPKSIGRLHNLETLDIDETKVESLPSGIVKLQNLRYLLMRRLNHVLYYTFNYITGTQAPPNISRLRNLQVLGCVEANRDLLREVRRMSQLVRLEISKVKESDEMNLCHAIQNMPLLRRLFVMASEGEILRMDALETPPPRLERLTLIGKLEQIPRWLHSLHSLRDLCLHSSRLENNPLPALQSLPNLRWLILIRAYEVKELNFLEGFENLEILEIHNCPELQSITIADRVMPGLKELFIGSCIQLNAMNWNIKFLSKLQELTLVNVPKELTDLSFLAAEHIPKINVYFTSFGWSQEGLS